MTRQLSMSLHKQEPRVGICDSMDGTDGRDYSSSKVSEMHGISTSLLRDVKEIASQFLESDRDVEFEKTEFIHFIIVCKICAQIDANLFTL